MLPPPPPLLLLLVCQALPLLRVLSGTANWVLLLLLLLLLLLQLQLLLLLLLLVLLLLVLLPLGTAKRVLRPWDWEHPRAQPHWAQLPHLLPGPRA